ncbi:MAG: SMC family ATPase [Chlorobiaceae bacterium]
MRIVSIHLQNIKSHRETLLSFSPGINVLSGANGAGKSTVFEAIGYALFGVDAKDFVSNVSRFVSIGAKSGKISVLFEDDAADVWRVSRTVGAASKWLLEKKTGAQFEVEEHAHIEETGTRIAKLLGLDNGRPLAEQFKLVIGPFQNEFLGPFIIKQTMSRQEAFDKILGIDTWRKTYKGTSVLLTAVHDRMKSHKEMIAHLIQQLAVLPQKELEQSETERSLVEGKSQLETIEGTLLQVQSRLAALDGREKKIAALAAIIEVLNGRIEAGTEKVSAQKLRVEEAEDAKKAVEASREGKEKYDSADRILIELRLKEQNRRTLEQKISASEKDVLVLAQKVELEEAGISKTEIDLDTEESRLCKDRLELLEKSGGDVDEKGLQALRDESERAKSERSVYQGKLDALEEGRTRLESGICPYFQEECGNIEGREPLDLFAAKSSALQDAAITLDGRISRLSASLKIAEAKVRKSAADLVRLEELEKQRASISEKRGINHQRREPLEILKKQLVELQNGIAPFKKELLKFAGVDADITKAERNRTLFQGARDSYTTNLSASEELESRTKILEEWSKILADLKKELQAKKLEHQGLLIEYNPEEHRLLRDEKDRSVAEVATRRQQILDLAKTLVRLENEREELKKVEDDVTLRQASIAELQKKERLVIFLRNHVFKNVSAQLSERFREEISLRADRIYRTIAESDEELVWGENYQIILRDMVDGATRERSDDQLSGGQTMSAVVALRLALLQTIGARIAFFDEPTSNLDASRRENLAHAFRAIDVGREELTEHWYDQLFLISHDIAFTEITDQIIAVGEDSGF